MIPSIHSEDQGHSPVQSSKSLLELYPHVQRFRLKNTTVVSLPVHQKRFDFLVLSGLADISALNAILQPEDLEAKPDKLKPSQGEVQLYLIDYTEGDAGPYTEMFEVFTVQERSAE